jgi:hypothetical protein
MEIVTGVFDTRQQAESAVNQLRALGLTEKQIGYVTPERKHAQPSVRVPVTDSEDSGMGQAMGAAVGGAMGAAGGATLGLAAAALIIPGVGPVLAFGLLGAALAGGAGAAVGAVVGESLEEGLGEGIPHEDIYLYEDALRHGRSIVVAYIDDESQSNSVREAMEASGALDIDKLREEWWAEVRDEESVHYQANDRDFARDELSYRRGFEAAHDSQCRGKTFSQVENELRERYSDLDTAFQRGYERGAARQSQIVEKRKD